MRGRILLSVLATLLALGAANAATVEHLSTQQMVAMSELVVVAKVTAQGQRVEPAPLQIFTETAFEVEQVLQGEKARPFLMIEQTGGVAFEGTEREVHLRVPGYPTFTVGERVVLFLERTPMGNLVICGLSQGKYTLSIDPKTGVEMATRDIHDLNLVRARRRADARFAGVPESMNHLPLHTLTRIIEGRPLVAQPVRVLGPVTEQVTLGEGE